MLATLRRVAATVLTVGLLAGAWRPCAGWEATAEARMSCCVRHAACAMHKVADDGAPAAPSQSDADACCAASERHDGLQPTVAVLAAPTLTPLAGLFAEPPSVPARSIDWNRPPPLLANRLPTHLLLSVFLI